VDTQNETNEPFLGPISKKKKYIYLKKNFFVNKNPFWMQRPFSDAGADEKPGIFFMWPYVISKTTIVAFFLGHLGLSLFQNKYRE
jgi:hypothetical protein